MKISKKYFVCLLYTLVLGFVLAPEKIFPVFLIQSKSLILTGVIVVSGILAFRYFVLKDLDTQNLKNKEKDIFSSKIISNLPFYIFLKTLDGKIQVTNQMHAKLFNMNASELEGMNVFNLYKDIDSSIKEDKIILQNKKYNISERCVNTINGSLGWCRIVKTPVLDKNGNITSIAVAFVNIDNEKNLQDSKDTFIANITHDLKTPTIAQIRALEMLLENTYGSMTDEQKEIVSQIKESCEYMYSLVRTILETYRFDNGQTKITYSVFDLSKLVTETISEISSLAEEKGQNIIFKSGLLSDFINADEVLIKRVIMNLISNAITYGFKNTDIIVSTNDNDTTMTLQVLNKSKYIPEAELKEVYNKFKTSSNTKFAKAGAGLGLYLSKQIVEAHKGKIFATSNQDNTCIFGFSIPKATANTGSVISDSCNHIIDCKKQESETV